MRIIYSSPFIKQFKRLPQGLQEEINKEKGVILMSEIGSHNIYK